MPQMIPDEIPSHADEWEKTVFETLKRGVPVQSGDWIVFHSIQVPQRQDPKDPRVIDFVIIIPDLLVVICLFVTPPPSLLKRFFSPSPLNLAQDAMEDLRSHFKTRHFLDDSPLTLRCAVVSPDKALKRAEIIVFEGSRYSADLDRLEDTLVDYVVHLPEVLDKLDRYHEKWDEAQQARNELQFDLDPANIPTATIVENYHRQLLQLTTDQFGSLRQVELNSRCVIDGAAGTGKTVLAKELAKRRCEEHKSEIVGLLCSNRYLSHHFESWMNTLPSDIGGRILVGTPSTLPGKIFEKNNHLAKQYEQRLDRSPRLEQTLRAGSLDDGWEDFLRNTVTDLKPLIGNGVFDYLIVDEAQNLCDQVFLDLMSVLLKNGLTKGRWTMFGDFSNQDIVTLDRGLDGREKLEEYGLHWSNDKLETNCRNTHEIIDAVAKLLNIKSLPRSGVHGPHVQIELFASLDALNTMLAARVSSWKNRGFKPRDITLLSSGTENVFEDIMSKYGDKYDEWKLCPLYSDDSSQDNILRYSDIYDFQGLESNLVILVMPETGDEVTLKLAGGIVIRRVQHLEKVFYTGMSRAHAMLVILAHESYRDILQASWPDPL